MSVVKDYIKTRSVAIIITIVILVLGSIFYFGTNIASRNDALMYEEIYGENVVSDTIGMPDLINNTGGSDIATDVNIKTALV